MKTHYSGGCQCGKVRYDVMLDLERVTSCNCSRCARLGWLMAFAPSEDFTLVTGADETLAYTFNKHVISHRFCRTCGIESFASGVRPDGTHMVAVNVRCLDGVDVDTLPVKKFDGRAL